MSNNIKPDVWLRDDGDGFLEFTSYNDPAGTRYKPVEELQTAEVLGSNSTRLLNAEQQQRLITAVRFYATTANYSNHWRINDKNHIMEDKGTIAKTALALIGI